MTDRTDKEILTALHQYMIKRKRIVRAISAFLLIAQFVGFVLTVKELQSNSLNLIFFGGLILIFAMVFSGRIALYLARREYRENYREEDLLRYSDAEDLGSDIDEVLQLIARRRIEWT